MIEISILIQNIYVNMYLEFLVSHKYENVLKYFCNPFSKKVKQVTD